MCNNFNNCDLILPRGIVPDAENRITVDFNGNQIQIYANSDYARQEWINRVAGHNLGYYSGHEKLNFFMFNQNGDLRSLKEGISSYEFIGIRICEIIELFNSNNLGISLTGIYLTNIYNKKNLINITIYPDHNNYFNKNNSIVMKDNVAIKYYEGIKLDYNKWSNHFASFHGLQFL